MTRIVCETWRNNVLRYVAREKGFNSSSCEIIQGDVRQLDIESLADIDGLLPRISM